MKFENLKNEILEAQTPLVIEGLTFNAKEDLFLSITKELGDLEYIVQITSNVNPIIRAFKEIYSNEKVKIIDFNTIDLKGFADSLGQSLEDMISSRRSAIRKKIYLWIEADGFNFDINLTRLLAESRPKSIVPIIFASDIQTISSDDKIKESILGNIGHIYSRSQATLKYFNNQAFVIFIDDDESEKIPDWVPN